jgi:hypothetical protein
MRRLATLLPIAALWAGAADLNGTYKGTWSGGQASGDITMTLTTAGGATKAVVSFAFGGQDVKCNVTSVKRGWREDRNRLRIRLGRRQAAIHRNRRVEGHDSGRQLQDEVAGGRLRGGRRDLESNI